MIKAPIIILHGWGLRGQVYKELVNLIKKTGHDIYSFDLPGFGVEPLVHHQMVLDDYVAFVRKFIEKRKLIKPILIGHSFGGRIAIKYAYKYQDDVSQLILTGVPIIRHKSFAKKLAFLAAVIGGKVFQLFPKNLQNFTRRVLYASIGEWDYYKAGRLKQVFKNIIGEELVGYAKEIKLPTLLVWGADDKIVPASDIEKIKTYMPHAKSFIIENIGHKLPYIKPQAFFEAIRLAL